MLLVCDGWAVYIDRNFPAECIVETIVLRGGGQVLVAADNVRDLHQMVIHNVCEVISWKSVGFDEDHIVKLRVVYCDISVDLIVEGGGSLFRVVLADNERHSCL